MKRNVSNPQSLLGDLVHCILLLNSDTFMQRHNGRRVVKILA